jgi:2-amino-4-hydroxy-6-hydroxymethyldihydropteridine diphosphokinase
MADEQKHSVRVFIGVGSNIDPYANIERALDALGDRMNVTAISPFYRSRAVGADGQPDFVNGVFAAAAGLPPRELKYGLLRRVEASLERRRTTDKSEARTIDLDLLLYGDRVVDELGLTVPDPGLRRYPFVALPLLDLEPGMVLPGGAEKLIDLFPGRAEEYGLVPLPEFSAALAARRAGGKGEQR